MDATVVFLATDLHGGRALPRRRVELVGSVRVKVLNIPERIHIGDKIPLNIFGNLDEADVPVIVRRGYMKNNIRLYCNGCQLFLKKLAESVGSRMIRKDKVGYKEFHHYELPPQNW